MRPQRHTSPDTRLTLISGPTITIDAANPQGRADWIIELTPGDWHTHPDPDTPEQSAEAILRDILEDRTILALTEREDPDLVILDMMMPKRSGFLVLEKLRRTRETPVRVIMITANEGNRHKAYAEMLGVDDYIRKPFPMDRLIESVKRLIG